MKKFFLFLFSFLMLLTIVGCDSENTVPPKETSETQSSMQTVESETSEKEISEPEDSPLKYDQMGMKKLGETFEAKIGQGVVVDGMTIAFKKVTEESRCPTGPGAPMCAWSGQVVVLLGISKPGQMETVLKVSSIDPVTVPDSNTAGDLRITMKKVEPERVMDQPKDGQPIGSPKDIKESEYVFTMVVQRGFEEPKVEPKVPAETYEQKVSRKAQPFLPTQGIAFFIDRNGNKNHRMMIDFEKKELSYAVTASEEPFVSSVANIQKKLVNSDLEKIENLIDQAGLLAPGRSSKQEPEISVFFMEDGEIELTGPIRELDSYFSRIYDYIFDLTDMPQDLNLENR